MIHEFVIDPDVFITLEDTRYLREELQIHRGRVVGDFSGDWLTRVLAKTQKLPHLRRKRLHEWLKKIVLCARERQASHLSDGWLAAAKQIQVRDGQPYRAVLACEENEEARVVDARVVDSSCKIWHVPTQLKIKRQDEDLAGACRFFMLHANKILLVEPYFDPNRSVNRNPLKRILDPCKERIKQPPVVELHTHKHKSFNHGFENDAAEYLPRCVPAGVQLEIFIWISKRGGERFHRRYVLSDIGGMYYEGGLESGDSGHTTDVVLLEPKLNRDRKQDYHSSYSSFELSRKFTIEGEG